MSTFRIYFRSITASTIRTIEDLTELTMPTGKIWLSPDRDDYYQKVGIIKAGSNDDVWDITQNTDQCWTTHHQVTWWFSGNIRSSMIGDVIVHENGDAWMIDRHGEFTLIETGKQRQVKFDMSIPANAPRINPLGQEIIDHIHHSLLKQEQYKTGTPRQNLFTIIEQICDGYFKSDGLQRLARNLNVP